MCAVGLQMRWKQQENKNLIVEPGNRTALEKSPAQTLMDEELFLAKEVVSLFLFPSFLPPLFFLRMWFPKRAPTPGEHWWLLYNNNGFRILLSTGLIKQWAGSERTDSRFERGSPVGKMWSNSVAGCGDVVEEKKSPFMEQVLLLSYFKKLPRCPQPSATTALISWHHPHGGKPSHQQKSSDSLKVRTMVSFSIFFKQSSIIN